MPADVPLPPSPKHRVIPWPAVGRALGRTVLLLAAVSFLSLVLVDLAPGDILSDLRVNPRVTAETVERLRSQYGLDRPLAVRYGRWLASAAHGDFGFSAVYNGSVWPILRPRLINTALLSVTALVLAWLLALPLGVWSAASRGGVLDRVVGGTVSVLTAVPELLLALGALRLALATGWFPAGGMTSVDEAAGPLAHTRDLLHHAALPVAVLTAAQLPVLIRHVRAAMIDALGGRFLLMGRGLGIPRRRLLWRQTLKVAAAPLSALLGLSLASLLSASLAIEVVMGWPGLGPLLVEATLAHDAHLVAGATTAATLALLAGVGLGSSLGWLADPRLRAEGSP